MGQAAKINPFPCSEHGLCQFAAWLAGQKLQQYISWKVLAIISLHSLPMLEYLLGITLMNSCLPITPYNFMETTCVCSLQPESLDHIMLWAACLHNVFLWFSYIWESYFSQTSIWWKTSLSIRWYHPGFLLITKVSQGKNKGIKDWSFMTGCLKFCWMWV